MESSTVWAIGFVALVTGSIMAVLLGLVLEYRLNVARISAGLPANDGELSRQRRVLGWGLGLLFGGVAIFVGSVFFGLPGETDSEGQGIGLVLAAVGLAFLAYDYLAPRRHPRT